MLSVVIPVLDAHAVLAPTLAALAGPPVDEIVVADGGSRDATWELARTAGAMVVAAPRGRGTQLGAGAEAARGDWLLFLHADTRLADGWRDEVAAFVAQPASRGRAAAFRFALDSAHPAARRLERLVAWRCRTFGLAYGDQGLLIHRELYLALGGYPAVPLMEDVALVRRLGRARLHLFAVSAVTSAARYERDGWRRRPALNLLCLALYFLGVSPARLVRLYA